MADEHDLESGEEWDGIIEFTPDDLARWEAHYARNPGHRKMRDLVVSYARSRGGLTLQFWELKTGQWFGKPLMMRTDRIAEKLGVPHSELEKVLAETFAWVGPRLDADPDYQELNAFTYRHFTEAAIGVVRRAAELAVAAGDSKVVRAHLEAALDGAVPKEAVSADAAARVPFDRKTTDALRAAFDAARSADESVEVRHLRGALA